MIKATCVCVCVCVCVCIECQHPNNIECHTRCMLPRPSPRTRRASRPIPQPTPFKCCPKYDAYPRQKKRAKPFALNHPSLLLQVASTPSLLGNSSITSIIDSTTTLLSALSTSSLKPSSNTHTSAWSCVSSVVQATQTSVSRSRASEAAAANFADESARKLAAFAVRGQLAGQAPIVFSKDTSALKTAVGGQRCCCCSHQWHHHHQTYCCVPASMLHSSHGTHPLYVSTIERCTLTCLLRVRFNGCPPPPLPPSAFAPSSAVRVTCDHYHACIRIMLCISRQFFFADTTIPAAAAFNVRLPLRYTPTTQPLYNHQAFCLTPLQGP
jgi:hypothetical protein